MRKFKVIFIGILFCSIYQGTYAQKTFTNDLKSKIKGVLIDATDLLPVEFANVVLYTLKDSTVVTWSISDNKGGFELAKIANGEYKLAVTFVGYEKTTVSKVIVDKANFILDLGEIKLNKAATAIGEVEVVGIKNSVVTKIDKKVIDVSKDINSTGGTAIDVIKNVPGLTVDADGVVSLRGNASVSVLIDGRPTSIDATKLDQIPSSDIESIELITNPSARYNPEGKSGIINLKLKQKKEAGFNGNAMVTAGTGNKYNGSVNLNYNIGNVNFFASYTGMSKKIEATRHLFRESFLLDSMHFLTQDAKTNLDITSNKFNLGANINLNPKNSLTISYSVNPFKKIDADGTLSQYFNKSMTQTGTVFTDNSENSKSNSQDYLIGYRKTFDKAGEELTIDYTFANSNGDQTQPLTYHYPTSVQSQEILSNSNDYNSNIQLNWVYPISTDTKIESGIQSIIRGREDNLYLKNEVSGSFIEDLTQRNLFTYNEQIHSIYSIGTMKFDKVTVLTGARLEQSIIDGEQAVTSEKISQKYFNFYPSFNFMYSFDKNNELLFNYSRRINRPNSRMINPFADRSNLEVLRSGNPNIKPEYINSFEAGYNGTWQKSIVGFTLFYKQITDLINQVTILDSTGVSHIYPKNMSSGQNFGFELTYEQSITNWWKMNGNGSFYKNLIKGDNSESNSNYSYNGRINSTWTPVKKLSIQMIGNYTGPMVGIISKMDPQFSIDLAIKRDFLDDKLSLTLRASDIFNTLKNSYSSWGTNFNANNWRKMETRVVYFSVSYKFGSNGLSKNSKSNGNNESVHSTEIY